MSDLRLAFADVPDLPTTFLKSVTQSGLYRLIPGDVPQVLNAFDPETFDHDVLL
jgi:hypothetical protein